MHLQLVLAQACRDTETAHAATECSRRSGRKRIDMHMHGRSGHALAHRHGILIEKAVENAVSARRPPDIDQAYQLGRVDYKVSNLLGNKHIAAEQCRIIQSSVHFFPLEVDIVRCSCFLTPESVECREFRTFESRDIHVLI